MHNRSRFANVLWDASLRPGHTALVILLMLLFLIFLFLFLTLTAQPAQGQTFQVIHNFTGGADGGGPFSVTMDRVGNLYGTTYGFPDASNWGTVFKLSNQQSSWAFTLLYSFTPIDDGFSPNAGVILGNDGAIYGRTNRGVGSGCGGYGCGTVFRLTPPAKSPSAVAEGWAEDTLYQFTDGYVSSGVEDLILDQEGNISGTTQYGGGIGCGGFGCGTVYKLAPSLSGWTESVLYRFTGEYDGAQPLGGLTFDKSGNLYGTTLYGGNVGCYPGYSHGCGTVFRLSPSGNGWAETVLYTFECLDDGCYPVAGLTFDPTGNLYGTTGPSSPGSGPATVFELSPSTFGWTFTVLHTFTGRFAGSSASLSMDSAGNLYGATGYGNGVYGFGNIFKLTLSGGGWTYSSLHDFTGGSDGANPSGNLIFDASGNLYGTAAEGGTGCLGTGCGTVWEITP